MHSPEDSTSVVLATDSFLIGEGLEAILADLPDITVVGRVRRMDQLIESVDELGPDAVLICVRAQVVTTTAIVAASRHLRLTYPTLGIVVISDRVNGFALELLRGGPTGIAFLLDEELPDVDTVVHALRGSQMGATLVDPSVVSSLIRRGDAAGIDELTPREVDIVQQMAHGMSNRGIADELHISVKSIEKGVTAIFLKLGPFNQGFSDRRVSSALVYLRGQVDPFGSGKTPEHTEHPPARMVLLEGQRQASNGLMPPA
jgi:DNA-binding NarL/FixJ family response regulator